MSEGSLFSTPSLAFIVCRLFDDGHFLHHKTTDNSRDTEATQMTINRGMDKEDMEYYSAIKKNEIMPSAAAWMDLEIIILNKVSQRQIP